MTGRAFIAVALIVAFEANGQLDQQYERLLLPLTAHEVAGAFGSHWSTELWLVYGSAAASLVPFIPLGFCHIPPFQPTVVSVNRAVPEGFLCTAAGEPPGQFVYSNSVRELTASLRLREHSGRSAPIQLPVVRMEQFSSSPIHILGVPVDTGSRTSLRIYGADPERLPTARVRIYRERPDELLDEIIVPLTVQQKTYLLGHRPFLLRPPATELHDVTGRFVGLASSVRFEVTPIGDEALWAFASITDNDKQQVVLRTPQPSR